MLKGNMGKTGSIYCAIAACLAAAAISFGCTKAPSAADVTYIKSVYSLPVSYDPAQMNDGASLVFSELAYEGLLRLNNNFGFESSIAESWSTSSDGKVLTFKIRPSARFHNGEAVAAKDVVESLTRLVTPESKVSSFYESIVGARQYHSKKSKGVSGLRAINPTTVEITLEKPYPPIMFVLAGATAKILPAKHLAEKDFFAHPVGSGPFQFKERSTLFGHPAIRLERFLGNKERTGNLNEFVLLESSEADAINLASNGKIHDLANWPLNGSEKVFERGQHLRSTIAQTWIIGLNSRLKPFDDVNVRRAFRASLNAEGFRLKFYPDSDTADGYLPKGFPGSKVSRTVPAATKFKPSKTPIEIVIPDGLEHGSEIRAFLETEFSKTGWNVRVTIQKWNEMMAAYSAKTMQAFLVSMNVDYPDSDFLLRNFESTNSDNFSGLHDVKVDRLLAEARSTVDRVKREQLYQMAAELVDSLAVSINLFHPVAQTWISKCVEGFEPNLLADAYIDYSKVSLRSGCSTSGGQR